MDLPIIGLWLLEQKKVQVLPIFRRHIKTGTIFRAHFAHTIRMFGAFFLLFLCDDSVSVDWFALNIADIFYLWWISNVCFFLSFLVDGFFLVKIGIGLFFSTWLEFFSFNLWEKINFRFSSSPVHLFKIHPAKLFFDQGLRSYFRTTLHTLSMPRICAPKWHDLSFIVRQPRQSRLRKFAICFQYYRRFRRWIWYFHCKLNW